MFLQNRYLFSESPEDVIYVSFNAKLYNSIRFRHPILVKVIAQVNSNQMTDKRFVHEFRLETLAINLCNFFSVAS